MGVFDRTKLELNHFNPSFLICFDDFSVFLTLASRCESQVHSYKNETSKTILFQSTICISVHLFINLSLPFNKISCKIPRIKECHVKEGLKRFHLNGFTVARYVCSQTRKLGSPFQSPSCTLEVKRLIDRISETGQLLT